MTNRQELPQLQFDRLRKRVKECPCGKNNKDGKFSPYIGYENKGYCHACGETFLPDISGTGKSHNDRPFPVQSKKPLPVSFLPFEIFKEGLQGYENNNFVKYLKSLFGEEKTQELIVKYFIGTSNHWPGSTVFYQIDIQGNIRAGKIMLYNPLTGKRVQEPFSHITWVHSALKLPAYNLSQSLFGEHLLRDKVSTIALVESEKTAIIASVYFPELTWLATGGKGNLNLKQCKSLAGKNVIVFPDVNGYEDWEERAFELSHFATFIVSDYLEKGATEEEKRDGLDLADYLIRFDWKVFQADISISKQKKTETPDQNVNYTFPVSYGWDLVRDFPTESFKKDSEDYPRSNIVPGDWDNEIQELDSFFQGTTFSDGNFLLNPFTPVGSITDFLIFNLETARANNGKRYFREYLNRVIELMEYIKKAAQQNPDAEINN